MLTEALMAVVDHLEDPTWLEQQLGALGAKHVGYGVTAEMYDWVGDALLATLAEVAGTAWTPAVAQAWTDAYGAIVNLMRAGEAQAAE
jgi:hemoglobin-like flavoprotein